MPTGKRKCKVCGCLYDYCKTMRADTNMFRWQDVACCPEHGAIYFAQIAASRNQSAPVAEVRHAEEEEPADELFEEEFDDNDEELAIET